MNFIEGIFLNSVLESELHKGCHEAVTSQKLIQVSCCMIIVGFDCNLIAYWKHISDIQPEKEPDIGMPCYLGELPTIYLASEGSPQGKSDEAICQAHYGTNRILDFRSQRETFAKAEFSVTLESEPEQDVFSSVKLSITSGTKWNKTKFLSICGSKITISGSYTK